MSDDPVIRLAGAGKRYTKYEDSPMLLTAAMRFRTRTRRSTLWAVRGVDLDVERGECVGIIGKNGSGKSTTLQLLAGVTAPTEGLVAVRGRVAPLISVGVGFHPELTGRENVYVNGTVLGLQRRDIDRLFEDIVSFADIGSFIDTPVKFYSSGMFVRLGFSVAIHSTPDVLLVDEVLAVGDLAFQMKCFDRMMEIRDSGTTIVVVSHNLNAVRRMCSRTMVIHEGAPRFTGDTNEAISRYHDLLGEDRDPDEAASDPRRSERSGVAEIETFELLGADGEPTGHVDAGEEATVRFTVRFDADIENPVFGVGLANEAGVPVYGEGTMSAPTGSFTAGERVELNVPIRMELTTGSYGVTVGVQDADFVKLDETRPRLFYVTGRSFVRGVADLHADFRLTRSAGEPGETPAVRP